MYVQHGGKLILLLLEFNDTVRYISFLQSEINRCY